MSSCRLLIFFLADEINVSESDWPPIKPVLKKALISEENECNSPTFFVKVYMEGIPIGRKLNLLAHDGYHNLIRTLDHMFNTSIIC